MADDVDDHWLHHSTRPGRIYAKRRVFIHKGSMTPWHNHLLDDHMTFQVRGHKDFAMLPITDSHLIADVHAKEMYSFNVDLDKYPQYARIAPLCARLQPGDAIYIPPGWWHLAVAPYQDMGITIASTWGSAGRAILTKGVGGFFAKGNRDLRGLRLVLDDGLRALMRGK